MKLTEFFRLRMPDGTDPVNIEDFNDNFEVIDKELKKRISSGESASDVTVEFEAAESRQPLKSGEKLSVLMGKAHRFFTDLKTVAFSGKYGDLSERPTLGGAAGYKVADNDTTNNSEFLATARVAYEHGLEIDALSRDLNQRFPDGTGLQWDGTGLQWDGTNFWGTTADGMKVKLGSLTYRDFTITPTANSGSMSIDISDIPNYKDLILWETLFPRMLSDLDMANWNTSMLRTGVGYDWNYDADKGILSISSRHTECVLIQYGTGLKQRTVRVHYI